jgi:hypothetical protein
MNQNLDFLSVSASLLSETSKNVEGKKKIRRAINDWKSTAVMFCRENDRLIES